MMNIWHDISPLRITEQSFLVCVETPMGGRHGYQMDKESGMLALSQVLCAATRYPVNSGFIPRTLTENCTPLRALLVPGDALEPFCLVKCRAIGAFRVGDGKSQETRIVAVPEADPASVEYDEAAQLPGWMREELKRFFEIVQMLEGMPAYHSQWLDAAASREIITDAVKHYVERY